MLDGRYQPRGAPRSREAPPRQYGFIFADPMHDFASYRHAALVYRGRHERPPRFLDVASLLRHSHVDYRAAISLIPSFAHIIRER